jgi:ATP-dependent helicase/nuclease subunit B
VHLVDDQAARYGEFDAMSIVGLIQQDWPEAPRRNIFYPPSLLRALGWPSEKERRSGADARFLDLMGSASRLVMVSTFTLDNETLVPRSLQLDEMARARLPTLAVEKRQREPLFPDDELAMESIRLERLSATARTWLQLRVGRTPASASEFHGYLGAQTGTWSVSALETYLGCPFKFYAQHVLRLSEDPDDEEMMDPRRQGQFVHAVFEAFFKEWQATGHGAITRENLDDARAMFTDVVERSLDGLADAEGGLERTRLLGSSAAAGLGEAVFRMEAERPARVVKRLLEYPLRGEFEISTSTGSRTLSLAGKADRLDLLADGTFRLIDYKLGWPPDRARALQLPIYGVCAEQHFKKGGQPRILGEAAYLAFKGPRRVVPLFSTPSARGEVLAQAQQRLADTVSAIERGEFPPTPDDVFRCETCSFDSVCRKDYVGDV